MKCKCYLNNNYQVIGLCDIEEFNQKISQFKDNSWTQITMPENLKIPKDKPPVKSITKVFLSIKLTSNKIIKTPISGEPNIEGLKLTGKILLVSGKICQNIIYVSDTIGNTIHSVKFDVPFNTYIVIDKASDLENDKFCVYPCVEDVSVRPLDGKTLSKSITLFLFAHRITAFNPPIPPPPPIVKLPNVFIFKNLNNDEMVRIEFDKTNKKLIVTSTRENYGGGSNPVFTFKLRNPRGDKVTATINGDEDATNFIDGLNDFNYEVGDKIVILSKDPSKAALTNSPNMGDVYDVPNGSDQTFTINANSITPDIALPSLLKNKITVKSKNNREVLNIQFNKDNKTFIVSSKGVIPDPSSRDAYFTLLIKEDITGTTLLEGSLNSNEDGNTFKSAINNKSYNFSKGILILDYKDSSKIEISNYPSTGNIYTPNEGFNLFEIKNTGLADNEIPNRIKILGDNNEEVALIKFSINGNAIGFVKSSGAIGTNTILETIPYVEFLHYQSSGIGVFAQILGKRDASDFASKFTNRNINNGQPIRVFNKIPERIIITDYKNQREYKIGEEPEFLRKINNLTPYNLNYNKIRFKNRDNTSVLYIYFDKLGFSDIYIEPYSTGKVNKDSNLFSFKITDQNGVQRSNIKGSLIKGDTADNIYISDTLNSANISKEFSVGDILTIEYSDKSLVEVFDFPFTNPPKNPTGASIQKYRITQNGLVPIINTNLLPNKITVKSKTNQEVLSIQFNSDNKTFIVSSTGNIPDPSSSDAYFNLKLKDSNGKTLLEATLNTNENGENFKTVINSKSYDYLDASLILTYKDRSKVEISNYPNNGDSYNPDTEINIFKILDNGLVDNSLDSKIKILGDNGEEVCFIQFSKGSISIPVVKSTGAIGTNTLLQNAPYVEFLNYRIDEVRLFSQMLGRETASNFASKFTSDYVINNVIIMSMRLFNKISNRIIITNYKNKQEYEIGEEPEFLSIIGNNLSSLNLRYNKIRLKNRDNSSVLFIYFDKMLTTDIYIEPYSIGKVNEDTDSFSFKITAPDGTQRGKILGSLNKGETADNIYISDTPNSANISKGFSVGDILTIEYSDKSLVEIFDFPFTNPPSNPEGDSTQKYTITSDGLVPIKPISLLKNVFVFKNLSNEEMARIEFNITDKKLIATLTGKNYGGTTSDLTFSFMLFDQSTQAKPLIQGFVRKNEDAQTFVNTLNDFGFGVGNKIVILSEDASKVLLTNSPNMGDIYDVPSGSNQTFTINADSITPDKIPVMNSNIITVKSKSNEEVLKVEINKENQTFIVSSTGNIPDPSSSDAYFTLMIKDNNGNVLLEGTLNSNESGTGFKTSVNNKSYNFPNTSLILVYKDKNKIEISNYPNQGDTYTPNLDSNIFLITPNGLVDNSIPNKIIVLGDTNVGTREEVSSLQFSKGNQGVPVVTSTGVIGTTRFTNTSDYVEYLYYDVDGVKTHSKILGREDASRFASTINSTKIGIARGSAIRMFNKIERKIIITDYKGSSEYEIEEEAEFFKSNGNILEPYDLNYNKIRLKNSDDTGILYIYFDKITDDLIYIEVYSTGKRNVENNSFSFKITDPNGVQRGDIKGSLNDGETGDNVKITQDPTGPNISNIFNFGDILVLEYLDKTLVEIYDFPFNSPPYNPKGASIQKFEITKTGLKAIASTLLDNMFIFKNLNNEEMARVEFNTSTKKLVATSTGRNYGGTSSNAAMVFILVNSLGQIISGDINQNEDAQRLVNHLNNTDFDYNNTITVVAKEDSKILVTNLQPQGKDYVIPKSEEQLFKITPSGLILNMILSKIIVKSKNDEEVLRVQFNNDEKTFFVLLSEVFPDLSSTDEYFTLMMKNTSGNILLKGTLNSNDDGTAFKASINSQSYDLENSSLILIYKDKSKIEITDYPNVGDRYIPNLSSNIFIATTTGLIDNSLPNKIKILSDNRDEVASLQFSKGNQAVSVASFTGEVGTTSILNTKDYVEYLYYDFGGVKNYSKILGTEDGSKFSSRANLTETNIISGWPIRLFNKIKNRIVITDYKGEDEYEIGEEPEFFKSNSNILEPYDLNYNKIRLKNKDNSSVLYIYFDKLTSDQIYIEPYSTGITNLDSDFFSFKITASNGAQISNIQGRLNKGETADNINIAQNPNRPSMSNIFKLGDFLVLEYSDKTLVEIIDFPFTNPSYNPTGNFIQKFEITQNGLIPIAPTVLLPNAFIFKNLNNEEMARVDFNLSRKKLIVNITDKNYGGSGSNVAFTFRIVNSGITANLNENENAEKFRNTLNDANFDFNDKIVVFSKDASRVLLSNYPSSGQLYEVPNGTDQNFIVTPDRIKEGTVSSLLPNKITVKSQNNEEVLRIQFNKDAYRFVVSSTGIVADPTSNDDYFTIIVIAYDGQLQLQYSLKANENGDKFKAAINNTNYVFSLILVYKDKSKIEISNYPNLGDTYVPEFDSNVFIINPTGLADDSIPSKIKILGDNNEEVSFIQFIKTRFSLLGVSTTGVIGTNNISQTTPYVEFLHYQNSKYDIFAQILGRENASNFVSNFKGNAISSENPIRLFNKIPERIIITNYKNQSEYKIGEEPEFFKSDENNLIPYDLNYNKIALKNRDGSKVLYIYFDKIDAKTIYIEPYSTGKINRDSNSFSFKIIDSTGVVKNNIQGSLNRGDTGDSINVAQNPNDPNISKEFSFGDTLVLEYSDKTLVEIFDFPFINLPRNPMDASTQSFKITENGLQISSLTANRIRFNGFGNTEIASVGFNEVEKKLIVTSTGRIANNNFINVEYFKFTLKDATGGVKAEALVEGNENGDNFKTTLNNASFEYGDVISMRYKETDRVIIDNFINSNPFLQEDSFKITQDGLEKAYNYLPNDITFKGIGDLTVSMIRFNKDLKTLSVGSNNQEANYLFPNQEYFAFVLKGSNGVVKDEASVNGNDTALNFSNLLNKKSFEFGDFITLRYKENNRVLISNYPNAGQMFNPPDATKDFKITENGLEDGIAPVPPNFYQKLYNTLNITNFNGEVMVKIEFDLINKKLVATSTGVKDNSKDNKCILCGLTLNEGMIRLQYSMEPSYFINMINNQSFDFGDVLTIHYFYMNHIRIDNYPSNGEYYTPRENPHFESFKIEEFGLIKLT